MQTTRNRGSHAEQPWGELLFSRPWRLPHRLQTCSEPDLQGNDCSVQETAWPLFKRWSWLLGTASERRRMKNLASALSEELLQSLLSTLETKGYDDVKDAVLLAVRTGLRFNEITSLDWSALDEPARKLRVVSPKHFQPRILLLSDDVLQALLARRTRLGSNAGPVFGPASQTSLSRFKRGFSWHTTKAGKKITWSMLRQYCIAQFLKAVIDHPPTVVWR